VLLFAALVGTLAVEVAGDCPSEADVRARLAPLVERAHEGDRVRVSAVGGALEVELTHGATPPTVRKLPATGTCAEQAALVAAVVATWQSELAPRPVIQVLDEPGTAGEERHVPERGVAWDLGAAFVASLAGSDFAPGATVIAHVGPGRHAFAARLALTAQAPRPLALGSGNASWGRSSLELGAGAHIGTRRVRFDLSGSFALALFYVSGAGFMRELQAFDVDLGLGADARLGVRAGPVLPFVSVGIRGWLRELRVRAEQGDDGPVSAVVPRFEVLISVGLSYWR
jgi:hypothetical protein